MSLVMQFAHPGLPDCLQPADRDVGLPGPGEVRIRQHAIGLNFIDVYHRTGLYPLPLPAVPGVEAAGVIEAIGEGVHDLAVGQRVVYACVPGAYAQSRLLPAWRAISLPDHISFERAGANLLRGLTAHMLLTRVYPVVPGTVMLVHAAAGGLGSIVTRWAKRLGATVIGTVSAEEKVEAVLGHGADHVIVGRDADYATQVAALTSGKGVHFAVDGIGGTTLGRTLACIRPFGLLASVGQASGPPPPVSVDQLRSIALARPSVMAYGSDPAVYRKAAADVLAVADETLFGTPGTRYALADAATAHADLEAGRIIGHAVLMPG